MRFYVLGASFFLPDVLRVVVQTCGVGAVTGETQNFYPRVKELYSFGGKKCGKHVQHVVEGTQIGSDSAEALEQRLCRPMGAWGLPDYLMDEVVGVLSSEHGQSGPRWHALLKANHFGVDGEDGRLIHVLDRNSDACRGLEGRLDAACQVGLVGDHHRQHEGAVHLEIHRLGGARWGAVEGRQTKETKRGTMSAETVHCRSLTLNTVSMPSLVMGLVRMVKWPVGSPLTMR